MIDNIQIRFKEKDLLIHTKNKKTIIYNIKKKRHVKLSEEIYKYIRLAQEKNLNIKEFIDCFESVNDKKYINSILDIMIDNEIIDGRESTDENFKDAHLSLTNRCNLKCKHCSSSCSPSERDYMDTKQVLKLIDNLRNLNVRSLVLTGGEPLVREDFCEIVKYIKNNLPLVKFSLSTNATLINNKNIDFIINNFDEVDISLDGVDEESCSEIRGKGVFQKVLKVVEELHSRDFYQISISMVFGEKNFDKHERFKLLNERLNTRPIERYFVPIGRGEKNWETYSEEYSVLPLLVPNLREIGLKNSEKPQSCSCNACIEQIFINHDGNIYPCPSLVEDEYLIGSIFDKNILSSLRNNDFDNNVGFKNLSSLFPHNFEKCKECDVNIFCWKCPATVSYIKDNEKERNRWCSLVKHNMDFAVWGGN